MSSPSVMTRHRLRVRQNMELVILSMAPFRYRWCGLQLCTFLLKTVFGFRRQWKICVQLDQYRTCTSAFILKIDYICSVHDKLCSCGVCRANSCIAVNATVCATTHRSPPHQTTERSVTTICRMRHCLTCLTAEFGLFSAIEPLSVVSLHPVVIENMLRCHPLAVRHGPMSDN